MVGRGQRRMTAWDDTNVGSDIPTGTPAHIRLMGQGLDPEMRGCTLIRLMPNLHLRAASPGAVSGSQMVYFGVSLVSEDAFGAGTMPNPEVTGDFPVSGWLWRDTQLVVDETLANGPMPLIEVRRDLRSMRKLDRAALILTIFNQAQEGTTFNVRISGMVRALYKLP